MFVTKKKYNEDVKRLRSDIDNLRAVIIEIHGERAYFAALDRMNEPVKTLLDEDDADTALGDFLESEIRTNDATPLQPIETVDESGVKKLNMPSRKEYEDRVDQAIKLFMDRKTRSFVEKKLGVSRKTARKYLQMAIQKRKVKKADYETLNK